VPPGRRWVGSGIRGGLIPAISLHTFAQVDEMKFKPEDIVVINLSGHGDKDLNTYIDYFKL
jgi:tryptophan synthase beta chain